MSEDIVALLKKNVIQGRKNEEDEGIEEDLTGPGVVELTQQALDANIPANTIIMEGLTSGMAIVGQKFSAKDYYIPDMLASAEAVGAAMDILKPHLEGSGVSSKGKFAIVTVKGDIHDIGKNIVAILLKGAGYEVYDMGIDISTEKIIEYVKNEKPDYLGLSALLTTTMVVMSEIIEELKAAGLRDGIKVLVGGAAVSEEYATEIGADFYCMDGFDAVNKLDALQAA